MAKFEVPKLPYDYNALEPYISAQTMTVHHDKHHQAYVDNLNKAIDLHSEWASKTIEEIIKGWDKAPDDIKTALRNHGGGHYNHSLFWLMMSPKKEQSPNGDLLNAINAQFGSLDNFKKQFGAAAAKIFGSGWEWLVLDNDKLALVSTPNQDSPLTQGKTPILGLDVWEHAYYLDRQNRRPEYIEAWWHVVNWEEVAKRFADAKR